MSEEDEFLKYKKASNYPIDHAKVMGHMVETSGKLIEKLHEAMLEQDTKIAHIEAHEAYLELQLNQLKAELNKVIKLARHIDIKDDCFVIKFEKGYNPVVSLPFTESLHFPVHPL